MLKILPCILFISSLTFAYGLDLANQIGVDVSEINSKVEWISSLIFA